jgi:hypothetical protein
VIQDLTTYLIIHLVAACVFGVVHVAVIVGLYRRGGLWLFLPVALLAGCLALCACDFGEIRLGEFGLIVPPGVAGASRLVASFLSGSVWVCAAFGLWLLTVGNRKTKSGNGEPRCENCGYLLRGLPEPRCPECGRPFSIRLSAPPGSREPEPASEGRDPHGKMDEQE